MLDDLEGMPSESNDLFPVVLQNIAVWLLEVLESTGKMKKKGEFNMEQACPVV